MTTRGQLPYNPAVPLYYQLAQLLRSRMTGRASGDGRLPSEHALCLEFGVSRTTIRQALAFLKTQGLLASRRGVGTFVSGAPEGEARTEATGDPLHHGLGTTIRVISIERVAPPARVRELLGSAAEPDVLRIVRVHHLGGAPLSVVVTYIPRSLASAFTRRALRRASIYDILWRAQGLRIGKSVHTVRVARADEHVAPLLGVPLMDPVLHIRSEGYLEDGRPIRLTDNYFREGRYQYTAEMFWNQPRRARRATRSAIGSRNGQHRQHD